MLHFARHPLLTNVLRQRVARELGDGLQAALGDLVRVSVRHDHPRLADVLQRGLQKSLDTWAGRSDVKTHFVLVDFSGVYYEISARQHDGPTGLSSPAVRRERTPDPAFIARAAALLIGQDLGLVGTVVSAPDAGGQVRVRLRGGELGVSLDRWVKEGTIFALVPPGGGQAVPFALLRARGTAHNGEVACTLYHRYELPSVVGYQCLQLGTTTGPLRLRLMQEKADGSLVPLQTPLSIEVRRHGFSGAEALRISIIPRLNGHVDTSRMGEQGRFRDVAFVTLLGGGPLAQVPLPIVGDRPVVVPVPDASPASLAGLRLRAWKRGVAESLLVQINLFKEIQEMAARRGLSSQTLALARAGLERSRDDQRRLRAEKASLLRDTAASPPDLSAEERSLGELAEGEAELRRFIERQEKIDKEENDPRRKEWRLRVEDARLLEANGEAGQALAIYEKVLKEGYKNDALAGHVEKLKTLWPPKNDEHRAARAFLYHTWPGLKTAQDLEKHLAEAQEAFKVCKKAGDRFAARKLYLATEAHAKQLNKELSGLLPDVNIEDVRQARIIKKVAPALIQLATAAQAFLAEK